jgi:long-chain acyl-CoA synthetase
VALGYQESIDEVTGPGSWFEVEDGVVNGVAMKVFKNAPKALRDVFNPSRESDATYMVYEDEEWSYKKTHQEADALAYALVHTYNIKPGDRVGISMRNLPEWVVSFTAITGIGAVSVSMNSWWTEEELEFSLKDVGLSVLIVDSERIERATGPCERNGTKMITVREGNVVIPAIAKRWEDVVARGEAMPFVEITTDMDAIILFTSGTTGFPKGAVSTHQAVGNSMMAFSARASANGKRVEGLAQEKKDSPFPNVGILAVPLFHVTGMAVMLSNFAYQFKMVIMFKWDAERALQLIEKHHITTFTGVPTQSWDMVQHPNFSKYDTSSLNTVGGGGAPAPAKLVEQVDGAFKSGRPNLSYGMTETNAYGPGNVGTEYTSHPNSTGRTPLPGMELEIRDEDANPVPRNTSGEIWMKGPMLIRGYWNRPEANKETLVNGWLRTGDLGRIDEEGFIYIEDRAKDMIIRGGDNVYGAEVETGIYEIPEVYEAAVFGIKHERLGEEVACVIMTRPGMTLTEEQVSTYLNGRMAKYKIPTRIAFTTDPLPRNPAGKFLKRSMEKLYF